MRSLVKMVAVTGVLVSTIACNNVSQDSGFKWKVDRFADVEILRYQVKGFDSLALQEKLMIYYLSQAAIEGRDILFDQNGAYNLAIRRTLEAVYRDYKGDKKAPNFIAMEEYLKRVWFSNGIHHHYSNDKFTPSFSQDFLEEAVKSVSPELLYLADSETVDSRLSAILPVIFDPAVMPKRVNQAEGADLVVTSAGNYYQGVTQKEAEDFYAQMKNPKDLRPVSYGLNSRLVKQDGKLIEQVWREGGLYGQAIEKVSYWLAKAMPYAANDHQKRVIAQLIEFNKTGDLSMFDSYCIDWVSDIDSRVDFVNGFTETYGDPLGLKGSWESLVNFKDIEATKRTIKISDNAQWFEDHSPVDPQYKKREVKGVSAKVITAAMLGGDCYPASPLGINLPNSNWIRKEYGSKSVTIENIAYAYDQASQGSGFGQEFIWSDTERESIGQYGFLTDNLHTDLHECLGHGSGQLLPGVDPDALKNYGAPIEEARADLFALYFLADPKAVEIGLVPNDQAYKAEYYRYIMNGYMTQLVRIEQGRDIEQAHMRNRHLIAQWVFEKGASDKVVELRDKEGKSYIVINDYQALRELFGQLLAEIQRIKSNGDFEAAKSMVERYAVKIDPTFHKQILARYATLKLAPYKGFVNPIYQPVYNDKKEIIDVKLSYEESFIDQHLRYSKDHSWLPTYNK